MYMVHSLLLLVLSGAPCDPGVAGNPPSLDARSAAWAATAHARPADSLKLAYERGQTWEAFYDATDRRRELWVSNWAIA